MESVFEIRGAPKNLILSWISTCVIHVDSRIKPTDREFVGRRARVKETARFLQDFKSQPPSSLHH